MQRCHVIKLIFVDHSWIILLPPSPSSGWVCSGEVGLEATLLHHQIILLSLHPFSLFPLQICFMHQPVLDGNEKAWVTGSWKIHCTIGRVHASVTCTIIQSVRLLLTPIYWCWPFVSILELWSEWTVFLNLLVHLSNLGLVSQPLSFGLGFGKSTPPLIFWS